MVRNLLNLWKEVLCVFHSQHRGLHQGTGMWTEMVFEEGCVNVIIEQRALFVHSLHLLVLQ